MTLTAPVQRTSRYELTIDSATGELRCGARTRTGTQPNDWALAGIKRPKPGACRPPRVLDALRAASVSPVPDGCGAVEEGPAEQGRLSPSSKTEDAKSTCRPGFHFTPISAEWSPWRSFLLWLGSPDGENGKAPAAVQSPAQRFRWADSVVPRSGAQASSPVWEREFKVFLTSAPGQSA